MCAIKELKNVCSFIRFLITSFSAIHCLCRFKLTICWHYSLCLAASCCASRVDAFRWGNCRSSQLDVRGLLLVELAAACTGVRWTVSQLVMQNEQKCSLRHPLDMVAHVQPWMLLAILPLVLIFERQSFLFFTIAPYCWYMRMCAALSVNNPVIIGRENKENSCFRG